MPLPDADKKSPRVYTLSQNTDLENMAFATMQSIGQPINIEEMNEDELRRLVLVNLARLSVAGEWDGLLSAGGGTFNVNLTKAESIDTNMDCDVVTTTAPWGVNGGNLEANFARQAPQYYPFIASTTGTVASMLINVDTAATGTNTLECAIYSDDDGVPDAILTKCTFDGETSGDQEQTSLTGTASLTRGNQYWIGHCETSSPGFKVLALDGYYPYCGQSAGPGSGFRLLSETGTDFSLPSSTTPANLTGSTYKGNFCVGLTYD